MALEPLATAADLTARGVTLTVPEQDYVTAMCTVASDVIRTAAKSPISQVTDTVILSAEGDTLILPGGPVTAVSAVVVDGETVEDFWLHNGTLTWRRHWRRHHHRTDKVVVTYTHGLPTVPADIVDLTCKLVGRALMAFRDDPLAAIADRPVINERIGDYSVTYTYSPTFSYMELPTYLRTQLAARFGGSTASARVV